ncbi:AAA family ATPase [Streptomyces eurocidicus]|uniref:AAA family ATPase n=1 Tax=Streptomyces eurocidicus TaxID=66423 RepID=UPI000C9B1550|nr:ATP-binding protein [Streptomyces eurocidicus]
MTLYGRHHEKAELDRVLDGAREGTGAGLVLWGDPGIGKTALLEDTALTAADFTVLCCRGTRMESGLAFAALHELLWPVVDRIGTLPAPQAAALRGALGHHRDPADRFLIGAAVLTLLSELAGEQPVLLAVDDAQWLDEPTVACLCFVARRVRTEPVALLLATHADPARGPWDQLPSLEVTGLADADARLFAAATWPTADELTLARTVRAAGGNPLALQELPGTLDLAGPAAPGAPRPMAGPPPAAARPSPPPHPSPSAPVCAAPSTPVSTRSPRPPAPCSCSSPPRSAASSGRCAAPPRSSASATTPGTRCTGRGCWPRATAGCGYATPSPVPWSTRRRRPPGGGPRTGPSPACWPARTPTSCAPGTWPPPATGRTRRWPRC